ncbi:hypothetical protein [Hymenobacter swuensis]|uniref:Uncharacterized protein n=1 Tax=Hymenobacter swuensis DY53 TaxID=1227739 RepID=W8EYQ8_9BACT|nr:hypothetical protein [Hymenobacter swuensis]AHJ97738.1 hypothetical protein Hsw_2143 [Hymenobacter swuensis DY53]
MCPDCFPAGVSGFPSWWEYEAFAQQLPRKPLTLLPAASDPVVRYACPTCREVWVLSEPEGAWRGYFLPEPAAAVYTQRLMMGDKARRLGCFGLLLAAALYAGWRWLCVA